MRELSRVWTASSGRLSTRKIWIARTTNVARCRPPLGPSHMARRYNATQNTPSRPSSTSPTAQTAPTSAKTIPGPNWLWLEPIYEPFRAYGRAQKRRPYVTQFVSVLVIYFVGDLVAQRIGKPSPQAATESSTGHVSEETKGWILDWVEGRDWHRTGRALLIGGLAAVPGYRWFLWLEHSFNYSSKILSLATKVAVNQLTFTPVFNSYFFGMQYWLTPSDTHRTFSDFIERLQNTVPVSWANSCKIWPAVTAFSFAFVPLHYRAIVGGVVAIGWQTYLSLLNQRAAAAEEAAALAHSLAPEENLDGKEVARS